MGRRSGIVSLFLAVFMALGIVAAGADSVSGGGQTPLSAALGFSVHSNLNGQLNYNADPQGPDAGFSAHCSEFTSYLQRTVAGGYEQVVVTGWCVDQDGNPVRIRAAFTDRGTPGQGPGDLVCIQFLYGSGVFIHDHGVMQSGNITIHEDPNNASGTMAEITAT